LATKQPNPNLICSNCLWICVIAPQTFFLIWGILRPQTDE
jgi:hypothetical protein